MYQRAISFVNFRIHHLTRVLYYDIVANIERWTTKCQPIREYLWAIQPSFQVITRRNSSWKRCINKVHRSSTLKVTIYPGYCVMRLWRIWMLTNTKIFRCGSEWLLISSHNTASSTKYFLSFFLFSRTFNIAYLLKSQQLYRENLITILMYVTIFFQSWFSKFNLFFSIYLLDIRTTYD